MSTEKARTRWGGITDDQFPPSGYFQVDQRDGIHWLVDPDGGRFLSKGVNTVRFDQDQIQHSDRIPYAEACQRKFGSKDAWRIAAAERLSTWGFNTLGSWSDEAVASAGRVPLAVTPNLDLGMSFAWVKNNQGVHQQHFPDVFDPDFSLHVRHRAREICSKQRDNPGIIGWFIDNELRWGPDWRGDDELLTLFLNLSSRSAGRAAALAWLRERHHEFEAFNSSWRTRAQSWEDLSSLMQIEQPHRRLPPYERNERIEHQANRADPGRCRFVADCNAFVDLLAKRYFELTCAAIKEADANHLVLGSRFAYPPPIPVIETCGRHADVISFNCYALDANAAIDTYARTGKPCLIGEFSFRAADSNLPNTNGAGPKVETQAERAACFRHYVNAAVKKSTLVGYHWFEHADQPAEGRFDGENSNFGTVTIDDHVYEDLTRTMTSVNAMVEDVHASAREAASSQRMRR